MNPSKAFDTINHELLVAELHAYGFSVEIIDFLIKLVSAILYILPKVSSYKFMKNTFVLSKIPFYSQDIQVLYFPCTLIFLLLVISEFIGEAS